MSAVAITEARRRLGAQLAVALPNAKVTDNATEDRTDGPVIYLGDASGTVDINSMMANARRNIYEWTLELIVFGRKWHTTAAAAEAEVASALDAIDAAIAASPQLVETGDPDGGQPGLWWCRVTGLEMPKADHGEDPASGGADQWTAAGGVVITLTTRKV